MRGRAVRAFAASGGAASVLPEPTVPAMSLDVSRRVCFMSTGGVAREPQPAGPGLLPDRHPRIPRAPRGPSLCTPILDSFGVYTYFLHYGGFCFVRTTRLGRS